MAASQFSLLLLALLALTSSTLALSGSEPTIYEILQQYGLPPGLVPDSITSYTFDPSDGSFVVTLKKPCYIKFDYLVYYDTKISGKISYGAVTEMKGIQAQSFVFWLNLDAVKVESGSVYFTLGIITKKLDIAQFEMIHSCKDNVLAACDIDHSSKFRSKLISQLSVTAEE